METSIFEILRYLMYAILSTIVCVCVFFFGWGGEYGKMEGLCNAHSVPRSCPPYVPASIGSLHVETIF